MEADTKQILEEALSRRTIAVISHPDAGKSTLSEALLLHSDAITEAGAVHGKAGRRGTVSDWMDMEKARGISVSSAVLQFKVGEAVVNLVDTPGHADFSEDTFRVLAAVDAVIMLIDAAKGMEAQTMKLFEVCRARSLPVITVINKWDRPGQTALELVDEILTRTGMRSMPRNWPVGDSGHMLGLLHPDAMSMNRYVRAPGGAKKVLAEPLSAEIAETEYPVEWQTAVEESSLLEVDGSFYDRDAFLSQEATPLFFASAVQNIGVEELLRFLMEEGPHPQDRPDEEGSPHPITSDFSGYVFKVQTGMDKAHRDRIAFMRICSGVFERGMVATHAQSEKPFPTKYSQQVFGRDRTTVDTAWPGDVVGLVNASSLRPGDTLYAGQRVMFPPFKPFAPEHFRVGKTGDASKHKQFRKGIEQLDREGVIQVFFSERRGQQRPVLGAVGPMQFEVVSARMESDFGASVSFEPLEYSVARDIDEQAAEILRERQDCEVLYRSDGTPVALFRDPWRLRTVQRDHPHLLPDPPGSRTSGSATARM
ncbi:peptide chain release factor 3 [Nesterenkonia lutea]|uniref:Peptide chain release factor 3 n=1 Tax=Nesterenkonia lutea TaxID=272919 RepID=A0ABR9JCE2_9MICC|nr:peptide chain release factor 3 [Nesterenkonia lutea]MBE1523611.1 peptide chain release factor 3 [Nesterenkonia lutea]